jgi:hypothetical protein
VQEAPKPHPGGLLGDSLELPLTERRIRSTSDMNS